MLSKRISDDPMIIEWFDGMTLAPNTRRNYATGMKMFCEYTGMSPERLIEEAEGEILTGTLMRKRRIKRHIIGFNVKLQNGVSAPKTIRNHMIAVRGFYKFFDIDLPSMQRRGKPAKPMPENDTRLTRDDVLTMLDYAGVRDKAIILIIASSGLATADILDLRVGTIRNGHDNVTGITTLSLRRKKTDHDFVTFITPEAADAIRSYLDLRDKNEKTSIKTDNDYVFIKSNVPDGYLETYNDSLRVLDRKGLISAFRRVGERCGKQTGKGTWGVVRAHNLRKLFNQTLLNAGADSRFSEFLMGHVTDSVTAAYWKADPGVLKKKYLTFVPQLSFSSVEVKTIESAEYRELKDAVDELTRFLIPDDEQDPNATLDERVKHIKREHVDTMDAIANTWDE